MRPRLEGLEPRALLATVINEFPLATTLSPPQAITTGSDGKLWFTEVSASTFNVVAEFDPTTHALVEYPVPVLFPPPRYITTGPDGNLWFANSSAGTICQFNPTTHEFAQFSPPSRAIVNFITTGSDGNLWFNELGAVDKLGSFNPVTHEFAEYALPAPYTNPGDVSSGPDGNIWFTNGRPIPFSIWPYIGRFDLKTHEFSEVQLPLELGGPYGITSGPDGGLWAAGPALIRIDPSTLSLEIFPGSVGTWITTGSDGNLWITEDGGIAITRFDPVSHTSTQYDLPSPNSGPFPSTSGPDGNIWFTWFNDVDGSSIGQLVINDGPTVSSVRRFGVHLSPTTLVLTVDQALDPASAQNPSAYKLVSPRGRTLALASATYDAAAHTIALKPLRRLNLHVPYTLTVSGTGPNAVRNNGGVPLDGAKTGLPGSDYTVKVTAANWVRPHRRPPAHGRSPRVLRRGEAGRM